VSEGTHDKGIGYTALSTSIIVSFLLFALCFQWLGLLGFPDSTQHLFSGLSPDDRQWLGMSNFNPYLLIADFIVLQLAIFLLHARINQIYAARAAAAPVTVKLQIESTIDRELRHSSQPYTSSDSGTSISLLRCEPVAYAASANSDVATNVSHLASDPLADDDNALETDALLDGHAERAEVQADSSDMIVEDDEDEDDEDTIVAAAARSSIADIHQGDITVQADDRMVRVGDSEIHDFTGKPRSWGDWMQWVYYRFSSTAVLFILLFGSTVQGAFRASKRERERERERIRSNSQ